MSALGQKQTLERASGMSALPPESGHFPRGRRCPLSAKSGHLALITRMSLCGSKVDVVAMLWSGLACARVSPDAGK